MQIPLPKPQASSPKAAAAVVKNILIRHSCSKEVRFSKNYEHPEISHLLKYAPKYYRSLIIQITPSHPLISRVKKIKKLKTFTGYFPRALPHKLWFNLLTNNLKQVEEIPSIINANRNFEPSKSFWQRLNLHKIKLLPNMRKISPPTSRFDHQADSNDSFLSAKEVFVKYVRNMRRIRSLQIHVDSSNVREVKWLLSKLGRLQPEIFGLKIQDVDEEHIQELFQNKKVFSQLTGLSLKMRFFSIYAEILQVCKNLKSLSFGLADDLPEFRNFLTSIQHLSQLKSLDFYSSGVGWEYFKPQPSLRSLKIAFPDKTLVKGLSLRHWEEISELDFLDLNLPLAKPEEMVHSETSFITMVLKKIKKLKSLKLLIRCESINIPQYEPFFIREIPHIYESLQHLDFALYNSKIGSSKFDLGILKPFCNLKQLRLQSWGPFYDNVKEAVNLLQGNQKEGEYPVLELTIEGVTDQDWLGNFLKTTQKIKRVEKNLKIVLALQFKTTKNYMELLERQCRDINAVKSIKNVEIHLRHFNHFDQEGLPVEEVKTILEKYTYVRNFTILLWSGAQSLECIKLDGQKPQFVMDTY